LRSGTQVVGDCCTVKRLVPTSPFKPGSFSVPLFPSPPFRDPHWVSSVLFLEKSFFPVVDFYFRFLFTQLGFSWKFLGLFQPFLMSETKVNCGGWRKSHYRDAFVVHILLAGLESCSERWLLKSFPTIVVALPLPFPPGGSFFESALLNCSSLFPSFLWSPSFFSFSFLVGVFFPSCGFSCYLHLSYALVEVLLFSLRPGFLLVRATAVGNLFVSLN